MDHVQGLLLLHFLGHKVRVDGLCNGVVHVGLGLVGLDTGRANNFGQVFKSGQLVSFS